MTENSSHQHTIAVVAKCPIRGKSKTRLIPLLGEEGSSKLAEAMLCDVLTTISNCPELASVRKILFYAPANDEGITIMTKLLQDLKLIDDWKLLPMTSSDLTAKDLGDILTDILKRSREMIAAENKRPGKVVFLGMDSPELPLEEIVDSLFSKEIRRAVLCPANDGGYGMLAVPPQAHIHTVFAGIRWSNPLTAVGQIKALTDDNVPITLGRLMNDVDEPGDVDGLCKRLGGNSGDEKTDTQTNDVLLKSSSKDGKILTGKCPYTRLVLRELKLIP